MRLGKVRITERIISEYDPNFSDIEHDERVSPGFKRFVDTLRLKVNDHWDKIGQRGLQDYVEATTAGSTGQQRDMCRLVMSEDEKSLLVGLDANEYMKNCKILGHHAPSMDTISKHVKTIGDVEAWLEMIGHVRQRVYDTWSDNYLVERVEAERKRLQEKHDVKNQAVVAKVQNAWHTQRDEDQGRADAYDEIMLKTPARWTQDEQDVMQKGTVVKWFGYCDLDKNNQRYHFRHDDIAQEKYRFYNNGRSIDEDLANVTDEDAHCRREMGEARERAKSTVRMPVTILGKKNMKSFTIMSNGEYVPKEAHITSLPSKNTKVRSYTTKNTDVYYMEEDNDKFVSTLDGSKSGYQEKVVVGDQVYYSFPDDVRRELDSRGKKGVWF
jgi:hypothetical protein